MDDGIQRVHFTSSRNESKLPLYQQVNSEFHGKMLSEYYHSIRVVGTEILCGSLTIGAIQKQGLGVAGIIGDCHLPLDLDMYPIHRVLQPPKPGPGSGLCPRVHTEKSTAPPASRSLEVAIAAIRWRSEYIHTHGHE